MKLDPVPLTGTFTRLEPMRRDHLAGLQAAAAHPEIWEWTWPGADPDTVAAWMEASFTAQEQGSELPFTTFDIATGEVAGSTKFMGIDIANKALEIGNTWLSPAYQRTPINTDAKWLMLRHAFETLEVNRVEFKTDANNAKSRAAIANLGAKEEGIRRRHLIVPGGRVRDSAYFSIIREEWPEVKARLEAKLAREWVRS